MVEQVGAPDLRRACADVSPNGRRRIFRLLCHVAHCDRLVPPAERDVLERWRDALAITPNEGERLEQEGARNEAIRIGRRPEEQRLLLEGIIEVAAADGRLDRSEQRRLVAVAGAMGLSQAQLLARLQRRFTQGLVPATGPLRPIPVTDPNLRAPRLDCPPTDLDRPAPLLAGGARRALPGSGPARGHERAPLGLTGPVATADAHDLERIARASMPTPRPDDPPTPLTPAEPPWAALGGGDTSLSLRPGALVLLGLGPRQLRLDLSTILFCQEHRGIDRVPPGLHHLAIAHPDGSQATLWFELPAGRSLVKVFDERTRRFGDPAPATRERYEAMARQGALTQALAPYPEDRALDWVELTVHLDPGRFPPPLHRADLPVGATRLEHCWRGTHRGDGQALLTEVSWAFLAGTLERHPDAYERWLHLLKSSFEVDVDLVREDPALFVLLTDLLCAQLSHMPRSFLDVSLACGATDLSDALEATGLPHLREAARRLRGAVA